MSINLIFKIAAVGILVSILSQVLVQEAGRVQTGSSGHRGSFSRVDLVGLSKNHAVTAYTSTTTPSPGPARTPLCGTPLRGGVLTASGEASAAG